MYASAANICMQLQISSMEMGNKRSDNCELPDELNKNEMVGSRASCEFPIFISKTVRKMKIQTPSKPVC